MSFDTLFNRTLLAWTPCTSPTSTCTATLSAEAPLGAVPGMCENATGVCVCPPTHSGSDLLYLWNDCHLVISSNASLELATAVIATFALVITIANVLVLLYQWQVFCCFGHIAAVDDETLPTVSSPTSAISPPIHAEPSATLNNDLSLSDDPLPLARRTSKDSRRPSQAERRPSNSETRRSSLLGLNLSGLQTPPPNAPSKIHQARVAIVTRRQMTLRIMAAMSVYSSTALSFAWIRVGLQIRLEQTWWLQLGLLTLAIICIVFGLCMIIYAWYMQLPNIMLFAPMYPSIRNSILVRHPNFVVGVLKTMCVSAILISVLVAFILPLINPTWLPVSLVNVGLTMLAVHVFIIISVLYLVCTMLLRLFKEVSLRGADNYVPSAAPQSPSRKSSGGSKGMLKTRSGKGAFIESTRMVSFVRIGGLGGGGLVVGMCLAMAFAPLAARNYTLFVSALLIGAAVIVIVVDVIVLWMAQTE